MNTYKAKNKKHTQANKIKNIKKHQQANKIKKQQTQYSPSPNVDIKSFPSLYYKLHRIWHHQEQTCETYFNYDKKNAHIGNVAQLMHTICEDLKGSTTTSTKSIMTIFEEKYKSTRPYMIHVPILTAKGLWIYNMNPEDHLPMTQKDLERVYEFVDVLFIGQCCQTLAHHDLIPYLREHMDICVCFFIHMISKTEF